MEWGVAGALFLGVKLPGREVDYHLLLLPRSKNAWSYTSLSQYAFMAWCSVKKGQRYNFTFYLTLYSPERYAYHKMFLHAQEGSGIYDMTPSPLLYFITHIPVHPSNALHNPLPQMRLSEPMIDASTAITLT
jgi:hypothetical protein